MTTELQLRSVTDKHGVLQQIKTSAKQTAWCVIHSGKKLLFFAEVSGIVNTKHEIFLAETRDECVEYAKSEGFEIPEGENRFPVIPKTSAQKP